MLAKLLLLFITVPLVELTLLFWIAKKTDWRLTLLFVLVTGFVGAWLARLQGWRTYRQIQQELASGRMPTAALLDAVMIFVAGALLLTPGILTDLFGISLLLPPCRHYYRRRLSDWFWANVKIQRYTSTESGSRDRIIDSCVVDRDA